MNYALCLYYSFFALAAALTVGAGSLHTVLDDSIKHFNGTEVLTAQLQLVLNVSCELAEKRSSNAQAQEIVQRLCATGVDGSQSVDNLLVASKGSLGLLTRLTEVDPIFIVLARRVFLAGLVLRWKTVGQWPLDSQLEDDLADAVMQFYRLHTDSVVRKGLLEYLHISKSGGSSFSIAARLSRCAMTHGIGQLEALGDLPHWINSTAFAEVTGGNNVMWSTFGQVQRESPAQGCQQRVDLIRSEGFSYVSNEYTLHGGLTDSAKTHVCPQVVNVVTLRNPDHRFVSHMHYMLARINKRIRGNTDAGTFHRVFCSGDVGVWERVTPAVVDNYVTRSFLGERGFHTPLGGIGPEQLSTALRLLLQFDLVLDLGAGDEATNTIMRQGLGWNITLGEVHVRSAEQSFRKLRYNTSECRNEALLAQVLPRQEPDRQLYSAGRAISFLDYLLLTLVRQLELQQVSLDEEGAGSASRSTLVSELQEHQQQQLAMSHGCGLLSSRQSANVTAAVAARAGLLGPGDKGKAEEQGGKARIRRRRQTAESRRLSARGSWRPRGGQAVVA